LDYGEFNDEIISGKSEYEVKVSRSNKQQKYRAGVLPGAIGREEKNKDEAVLDELKNRLTVIACDIKSEISNIKEQEKKIEALRILRFQVDALNIPMTTDLISSQEFGADVEDIEKIKRRKSWWKNAVRRVTKTKNKSTKKKKESKKNKNKDSSATKSCKGSKGSSSGSKKSK